jgi:plastocyanin
MPSPPRLALSGLAAALLALSACGGGGAAATPKAAPNAAANAAAAMKGMDMPAAAPSGPAVPTNAVTITNFAFSPGVVTVPVGTAVTWTNMDEEPHTVVDGAQGIKSPVLGNQGSHFTFTFAKPGTYSYNCSIHPFMHGTVVVTA